jgi:hypothetical protein
MSVSKPTTLLLGGAAVLFAAGQGTLAFAQQPTGDVVGELANNTGYFVDGKTFKIVKGTAKQSDAAAQFAKLEKMGAKEVGPGVIVFRYNDKLYMVEGSPPPAAQAMKSFQDNWNVSYMKGMKDFQDNWNTSYMKDFQSNWNVSYMKDNNTKDANEAYAKAMKDFQDNWNVSYMKAAKDFQDNWNVSYMKNQQDNWNVSYMKTVKDFQDNWSTSYMK